MDRKGHSVLGEIRALLGRIPMLALTATATTATRTALISQLGMQRCVEIVRSPDRPNIRLSVARIGSDLHHVFSPLINLGGVRHGGWPVYVNGHRPSLWPMTAREWPTLDIRSGAV